MTIEKSSFSCVECEYQGSSSFNLNLHVVRNHKRRSEPLHIQNTTEIQKKKTDQARNRKESENHYKRTDHDKNQNVTENHGSSSNYYENQTTTENQKSHTENHEGCTVKHDTVNTEKTDEELYVKNPGKKSLDDPEKLKIKNLQNENECDDFVFSDSNSLVKPEQSSIHPKTEITPARTFVVSADHVSSPGCKQALIKIKGTKASGHGRKITKVPNRFHCNLCSFSSARPCNLKVHVQAVHDKLRKHKCQKCARTFGYSHDLKRHIHVVHDKDAQRCPKCPSLYILNMDRHLLRCHGEGPLNSKADFSTGSVNYNKTLIGKSHSLKRAANQKKQHKCEECGKTFGLKSILTNHIALVHAEQNNMLLCPKCPERIDSLELEHHLHRSHGYRQCKLLLKKVDNRTDIEFQSNANKKKAVAEVLSEDQYCGKANGQSKALVRHAHIKNEADVASLKKFDCKLCDKTFAYSWNLRRHVQIIHDVNRKKFPCKLCPDTFVYSWDLLSHFKIIHEVDGKPRRFECKSCIKTFAYSWDLLRHVKKTSCLKKTSKQKKKHECKECGKTFRFKSTLSSHLKLVHNKQHAALRCPKCPGKISASDLGDHLHKTHGDKKCKLSLKIISIVENSENGPNYQSSSDHKNYYEEEQLKSLRIERNINKINGKPKRLDCKLCEKTFSSKETVVQHAKNVHQASGKSKRFSCKLCGKTFRYQWNLLRHVKNIHEVNGKKFECKFCAKTFRYSEGLDKHVKNVHCKKFECKFCGKFFGYSENLVKHIQNVHAVDGKKIECKLCGKTYGYIGNLVRHKKKRHHGQLDESNMEKYGEEGWIYPKVKLGFTDA